MIVFIGLATNDFISNRPLLVISRIAPSVSGFTQNTSAALTVPSFRRLPLFISTRILSYPVLLNLLLSYKTVIGFVFFAVTVTLLQLSFPSLVFQVALFYRLRRQKICAARAFYSSGECVEYITAGYFVSSTLLLFFTFFSLFLRFFYRFFTTF